MMQPGLLARMSALAFAAALANCATNPVTGNPNLVTMSEAQEVAIGRGEDPKVRQRYGVYPDAALQDYVTEVGRRLASRSHRPELDYQFLVVDSPEVNAFALPGGYVYITRGLMAYLSSEAELAAVLGHELGHVTARHAVQQLSAAAAASVGATVLQIFVPQARGILGDTAVGLLGNALLSGYGRDHELEADRLGAEYLARTGYDARAMVSVVGVLKNQELFDAEVAQQEGRAPRRYHGVFASHPDNDTRLQQVVTEAGRYQAADARAGHEEYLRRLDRMVYADSPSQGVVRGNRFYHAEFGIAFEFPAGWRVRNQARNVSATSAAQDALIDLRLAGEAKGSPADVLRRVARLGAGSDIAPTSIGGLPAAIAMTSMSGRPTRVAVVFHGGRAYAIGAQARSSDLFSQYEREFDASIASFHELTQAERRLARPLALRVITAQPGLTFAELARVSPLGRNAEGHLRVLNGMYPKGEPVAGQALKIVE